MSKSAKIFLFGILPLAGASIAAALALSKIAPSPEPANSPPPHSPPHTNAEQQIITLFFAGDIMLARNVYGRMNRANDYTLPFQKIADKIRGADISFANLESPFGSAGPYFVEGTLNFNADPKAIDGLNFAGFDILSTANNHSFDQGREGVLFTIDRLVDAKIQPVGTGIDCGEGKIIERNGIKFGFLAYSYAAYNDGGYARDPLVCDWNDLEQIKNDIAKLKPTTDVLIVSAHMGEEYKREPQPANVQKARMVIDEGADLFIGHHPHWIQTIEQYNGKWIFYSLGNLVFDQMWSADTKEGLTLLATFENNKIIKIELMPVIIENYCCPRWADELETKNILDKLDLTTTIL